MIKNLNEWRKFHPASYARAVNLGILKEIAEELGIPYQSQIPSSHWNVKTCTDIAETYDSVKNWRLGNLVSYNAAKKLQIHEDVARSLGWKVATPKNYWNYNTCLEDAKKYNSLYEWEKGAGSGYFTAKKLDIHRDIMGILGWELVKLDAGRWTYDRCLEDAKNWPDYTSWCKNSKSPSSAANKNQWKHQIAEAMGWIIKPKTPNKKAQD